MYLATVGLEIHAELKTRSKMFCDCNNDPLEKHPNINICPVCLGHPGTLPVINRAAVRKVIKTGLALNCIIPETSKFERKNYFYPDLPKGYQISQKDLPLCKEGYLELGEKKIRIRRVHLEEDTGRLLHSPGKDYSLVDFNRAGIPLMEVVTEPDIGSAKEASSFAKEFQLILRYLDVSLADMEKGQMRLEANISLKEEKAENFGVKVEIKNLNSFRALEKAIDYEIARQTKILESGKKVIQETRGWDAKREETVSQREKEESHDYRYFPEPDLPALQIKKSLVEEIRAEIPELPSHRRVRLVKEYGVSEDAAEIFVENKDLGEYFEKVVSELGEIPSREELQELIRLAANYLTTDLQGLLKDRGATGEDFLITAENFAEFVSLLKKGVLSSKTAKMVLAEMFATGKDPSNIIEEQGLSQLTGDAEIEKIVREVVEKNKNALEDYKKGKQQALQFLIGRVMADTKGRANIAEVVRLLKNLLK